MKKTQHLRNITTKHLTMKIESKMTVVEWLQEALEGSILNHEQIMQTIGLFEQAKEMEKHLIVIMIIGLLRIIITNLNLRNED